jgi:hypothetical protein
VAKGSEFGGQPGRIQPLPHDLTAAEEARLERATNPNRVDEDATTQRIVDSFGRGIGPVDDEGNL